MSDIGNACIVAGFISFYTKRPSRRDPPGAILQEVSKRIGGKPFRHIGVVISPTGLASLPKRHRRVAGFNRA